VSALAVFDDGTGTALYAGGDFVTAGGVVVSRVAKWDGGEWSPLGGGISGGWFAQVNALIVFDDGTGPALYAGGAFTNAGGVSANGIARWNGTSWSPLGSGVNGWVDALTVFDDGTGPALYAGGVLTTAGGVSANFIAKWNGTAWSPLGTGMTSPVSALTVFDDGTGPALYAGGEFSNAGGVSVNGIAKWDGTAWSALGSGMGGTVRALTVFDDGTGPALYVGGDFFGAGGVSAIGRWDGTSWSALGSGMSSTVRALTVFDDGTGPALYAGGRFSTAGSVSANRIAKWDGAAWGPLGPGMMGCGGFSCFPVVSALTVFDDGAGPALYAGGSFTFAGGVEANAIAKWDGTEWGPLGGGMRNSGGGTSRALAVFDDGNGPAVHAGGSFTAAGDVAANYIAKWDGAEWSPLGGGISGGGIWFAQVDALIVFDDGSGPALYAGGAFTTAGGVSANHIAKWDGTAWSPLGTGMTSPVSALTVFDDGTGPALYAGGFFTTAGGVEANRIARWDGTSWSALGSGVNNPVSALTVFDDGTGPALYAGGGFGTAGGVSAIGIARWNGTEWSALGSGVSNAVLALTVFDDGTGPALYAAGYFWTVDGLTLFAKWDGTSWSQFGSSQPPLGLQGMALTVFDDGTGPALYAGGDFTTVGGVAVNAIARWDGTAWSALGDGVGGSGFGVESVMALTVLDDGTGPALYAGGLFTNAGGGAANAIARWSCWFDCNSNGVPDHLETAAGLVADCNNNRVPDTCELAVEHASPTQSPFASGSPLVFTMASPPADSPVEIAIRVRASLSGPTRFATLRLNGSAVATLFLTDGEACPSTPQTRTVSIAAADFNAFSTAGTITVELVPSGSVGACLNSYAEVEIAYQSLPDCDGDGVWDECQIYENPFLDCNRNGVLDACEKYTPHPFDCNGNGIPDECELAASPGLDLNGDGILDACSFARGDFNLDGVVDGADLGVMLALWGIKNPEIGDLNGDGVVDGADLAVLLGNWGVLKW
jgi:hypothetical protein